MVEEDAHSAAAEGKKVAPNVIIGTRRLPWKESVVPPPPPPPLESHHIIASREIQESGHHAGATYFELKHFAQTIQKGPPYVPDVSFEDGLLAVAIGKKLIH